MGGILLIRDDGVAAPGIADHGAQPHGPDAEARAQFLRHGFSRLTDLSFAGWRLIHAAPIHSGQTESTQDEFKAPTGLYREGEDFVALAGTLHFDGQVGDVALRALLHADDGVSAPDWSRIGGQFVVLIHKHGRARLFTDYFGAFQIFHDQSASVFSTSMLAATAYLPRVHWNVQALYEYAFHVAVLGDDTVLAELERLGPDRMVMLERGSIQNHMLTKPLPAHIEHVRDKERIAHQCGQLHGLFAPYIEHFGNAVNAPLSGGLDSRLVLGSLNAAGCEPHVYVYGPPGSPDVNIAVAIGAVRGFDVEWIYKDALCPQEPDQFAERVATNFQIYDGLPNYGGIFDYGGNVAALQKRHAGGRLAVSGGCGEIFRNFFYLPDRPMTASAVTRSFFGRFAAADCTERFNPQRFLRATEDKILAALNRPGDRGPLPRPMIEQIYPRVRCRALFGWEISLEGRQGNYLMPFLDHHMVAAALTLPMRDKNAGAFEARMMTVIAPELAAEPSIYGHDFTVPPNRRHRLSEASTRARPVWLRQHSYALQRKLGRLGDSQGGVTARAIIGRVIDLAFPAMRRYFKPDGIADPELWRRIAALEYFAAHLGSKLVEE